jgi:cytochrome c oxidase subunit IV
MTSETRRVLVACKNLALLWLLLVLLVGATFAAAFLIVAPSLKTAINLAIAGIQVLIIAIVFMNLRTSTPLLRITAAAAIYWLVIMFTLTFNDYQSRPASSPCHEPAFTVQSPAQCEVQTR